MKTLYLFVLLSTFANADDSIGKVYHMSFNTDTFYPYFKLMIQEGADCSSTIKQSEFEEMLKHAPAEYDSRIIYNKLIFKNKTYFINREGIVSDSKNIYQLESKEQYENVLKENNLVCK